MNAKFELPGIVPWGRKFKEYEAFFALDAAALAGPVLDVGAGPSSFTGELCARGGKGLAADPIYAEANAAIAAGFEAARAPMRKAMLEAKERFNWKTYGSESAVETLREEALQAFMADRARAPERYVAASLPALPFADGTFHLALCSHLLFLYGDDLDAAFHLRAVKELARVAGEVRIFPLFNLDGRPSSHLPCVIKRLRQEGYVCETVTVPFEFQLGATQMLKVKGPAQ